MLYFICFVYRWHDSTIIKERLKAGNTVWPIPKIEQVFLPDFKIKPLINEQSFEVITPFYFIF